MKTTNMNSYNKKQATVEELNKLAPSILFFHYNKQPNFVIEENIEPVIKSSILIDINHSAQVLKHILSEISKRIHKYQQGDEKFDYFMKTGWKTPILTNTPTMSFILPEQFTQEFIDSKEGKRFKGKQPCAHMFMRALQSQKTIMEQLEVQEV